MQPVDVFDKMSQKMVISSLTGDLSDALWKESTHGDTLSELQCEPCFQGARKAHRSFLKYDSEKADALDAVVEGSVWPAMRANPREESKWTCRRCGRAPEDAIHRYYKCPDNDNIEDDHVKKTVTLSSKLSMTPTTRNGREASPRASSRLQNQIG